MKTMPTDSSFPTHLGSYRLEKRLGRGGMGEVFLAWDGRLERHVAIKRILNDPPPDAQARARFRREARAVARLSHPAIVQVFELLEADDGDCLVMEHLEGRGLTEVIAAGALDVADAVRLAAEIADGLAEAHAKGLIHRDLKPENVRLSASGRAKILDFGLARLLWDDALDRESLEQAVTRSGMLIGTVHAMSPEQASGRPVDHRSDLFALGGLLYEMLTGRAPFRGDNVLDTLRRVTGEAPEPLAELRPGLPVELHTLVEDLLAKDPADRPQNARLVVDALESLRDEAADVSAGAEPMRRESVEPPMLARDASDDQATGEWPAPVVDGGAVDAEWVDGGSVETVVRALVVADVVYRTSLLERLGVARAS
ncbi:MAG: serine/threonine-protein kinase [Acidobacteriota bacterium]